MKPEFEFDVFLSYQSADQEWAAKLKGALETRGLRIWFAPDEMEPGERVAEALDRGLTQSRCAVFIITPEAMESGWIKDEYERAVGLANGRERSLRLIPVVLAEADMPGFLQNRYAVDFRRPEAFEENVDRLVRGIRRLQDAEAVRPSKPIVAVTMGDANGIGPQVVLKALRSRCSAREICIPVVIGSYEHLQRERRSLLTAKYSIPALSRIGSVAEACDDSERIFVLDFGEPPPRFANSGPREPNPQLAMLSEQYTVYAVELAQRGEVAAIVSAPVSKEAALAAGTQSRGHAELIAERLGKDTHVMFLSAGIAVSLVTNHVPVEEAIPMLTEERITRTIVQAADQFHIWRPEAELKIGVCSVDPHAGEGGLLGLGDKQVVTPAVRAAREAIYERYPDATVDGPRPVDVLFRPQVLAHYTLIVALYHDQAKAAVAALGSNDFIAALAGGGIIRTTTTHGTAFDIAAGTTASSANLLQAIEHASYLSKEGTEYLLSSPDIHATKRYDIEKRLNRATAAKNQLGEHLCKLDAVTEFLSTEPGEFRVCFGPGSTPRTVAVHLLAWVRKKFADTHSGVAILTNNLLIHDYARSLGDDFLKQLCLFGGTWNRRNDSLDSDGYVSSKVHDFKPHLTVISCSGIIVEGGQAQFFAYNDDHAETLSGIIAANRRVIEEGNASRLVIVATGEKLGRSISCRYAIADDLPPHTTVLLELDTEVQSAVGNARISELVQKHIRLRLAGSHISA